MNQNILIVDDEYDALAWLKEMFQFEFDRETDVYAASSGVEALELLNRIKFDVVLTDIRMPGMDGITLFQRIKSNWPRCKTVFLTGYRNFDDMYQIINHKDVKFILKSERDEVIRQAVRESLDESRAELEQEALKELQREDLEKVRYWMGKDFMSGLLNGENNSTETIRKTVDRLDFPIRLLEKFLLVLIRIDQKESEAAYDSLESMNAIVQIMGRNLPKDIRMYLHRLERQQALMLIQPAAEGQRDWDYVFAAVKGAMEYAQDIFRRKYHRGFSAVIASTPADHVSISSVYLELKRILIGYLGGEQEVIAHFEALETEPEESAEVNTANKVPLLKSYLELRKRMPYFELLKQCCEELTDAASRHDSYAVELYYSIAVMLLQFINGNKLNQRIAFSIGLYKLTRVDVHDTWMEAAEYLFNVSVAIFDLLGENEYVLSDRALARVVQYIDTNLSGDLTLTKLADIGGFSTGYLSRLFKQHTKVSISDYVYQKRMELAQELLCKTNLKIQDIGGKAGYPSAQSFTRTFRTFAGLSPAEYRELHRKDVKEC